MSKTKIEIIGGAHAHLSHLAKDTKQSRIELVRSALALYSYVVTELTGGTTQGRNNKALAVLAASPRSLNTRIERKIKVPGLIR